MVIAALYFSLIVLYLFFRRTRLLHRTVYMYWLLFLVDETFVYKLKYGSFEKDKMQRTLHEMLHYFFL